MKDATNKALFELRLLAAHKLKCAAQDYLTVCDLECDDVESELKNLHMAANLITMLENYEKKLVENDDYNYLFTMTMYGERELVLRKMYSCNMSIAETLAWRELIGSFDSHHAGDNNL